MNKQLTSAKIVLMLSILLAGTSSLVAQSFYRWTGAANHDQRWSNPLNWEVSQTFAGDYSPARTAPGTQTTADHVTIIGGKVRLNVPSCQVASLEVAGGHLMLENSLAVVSLGGQSRIHNTTCTSKTGAHISVENKLLRVQQSTFEGAGLTTTSRHHVVFNNLFLETADFTLVKSASATQDDRIGGNVFLGQATLTNYSPRFEVLTQQIEGEWGGPDTFLAQPDILVSSRK